VTGSVAMIFEKVIDQATTDITGGVTSINSNPIMQPIDHPQLAQEGGSGSIAGLTELTINLRNQVIDQAQIGCVDPLDMRAGAFMADGTFSCYFSDATYITKHLAHTTTSLSFTIGGPSSLSRGPRGPGAAGGGRGCFT